MLANFEPNGVRLNRDTYQGTVGGVYKPFKSQNVNLRLERLFRIGDLSENNWLARVGWSYDYQQVRPEGAALHP